jgi:hypothetical protein
VTIDKKFLRQYPEYLDYIHHTKKGNEDTKIDHDVDADKTPEEIFEDSYQTINRILMQEVLDKVKSIVS